MQLLLSFYQLQTNSSRRDRWRALRRAALFIASSAKNILLILHADVVLTSSVVYARRVVGYAVVCISLLWSKTRSTQSACIIKDLLARRIATENECIVCYTLYFCTVLQYIQPARHRCPRRILNISWQDGLRNDRVRELTGHDRVLTKMREQRLQWWDLGVIYNRWRIEDKQNRHSIGFLRDHAKSVDRASPGMITLRKTLRVVESQ